MTERNFLNLSNTLPDGVTDSPASVAEFVRSRNGKLQVQPHPHYLHKDDPKVAQVAIELPLVYVEGAESKASSGYNYGSDRSEILGLRVQNKKAWAVAIRSGNVQYAHKYALLALWDSVIEYARWVHAQDAIVRVIT